MLEISFSGRGDQGLALASRMPGGSIIINTRRPPEALHEMTLANHELNIEAARLALDQVQTIEPGGVHG